MAYRILSLDGGGAWALIEVNALIALYSADTKGHDVLDDFDLVAANSGGSLVLGGLLENLALSDLLNYFQDESKRRSIFSPTKSWGDWTLEELTGLGPKYSAEAKLPALEQLMPNFGSRCVQGISAGIRRSGKDDVHLLIVGFDYDRNRATFFRSAQVTNPVPGAAPPGGSPTRTVPIWGDGAAAIVTLAEAIHASTNAPVNYFDAPAQLHSSPGRYWDGAITGCNNPVLAAITEAFALGQKPTDIAALSIGTGTMVLPLAAQGAPPSPYETPYVDSDLITDLRKLATSILDDPPDAASFIAHVMTGGGVGVAPIADSRVVRMNPLISPVKDATGNNWTAPPGMSPGQFKYLCGLDMDAVESSEVTAITQFCDLWLANNVLNQPIRMDGATFAPEIGYPTFAAAMRAWSAIK